MTDEAESRAVIAAKYTFSVEQRYALWRTWNFRCGHCGEPLRFLDVTVDHIIPETLLSKAAQLETVNRELGLPAGFDINDYGNWVPCHGICNSIKGPSIYEKGAAVFMLERAKGKVEACKRIEKSLIRERAADKVLAKLVADIEAGNVSRTEIYGAAGPIEGMSFVMFVPTVVTFQAQVSAKLGNELGASSYADLVKVLHKDLVERLDSATEAWFWDMDGFAPEDPPAANEEVVTWKMICTGLKVGELERFASTYWKIHEAAPAFQIPEDCNGWLLPGVTTPFHVKTQR